tara:strand:- start:68 stop:958 length:891 start_codon:yes stop_codon:yes gene_type:complete
MGLNVAAIQNLLELYGLGYFKKANNVLEIGSQELHLNVNVLEELFAGAGLKSELASKYPYVNNYPEKPRTPAKFFYETLGFKEYKSIDINGNFGAIPHDLNKPFKDTSLYNKFDVVTDFGSCEHVFNISECYRTMHNLTKPGGYIIIHQCIFKGNGYFNFDEGFFEGLAVANNYNIIYNSYVVQFENKTSGGEYEFHIPRNRELFDVLDYSKLQALNIYGILKKTKDEDFKIPYQGRLMNKMYNITGGFNRAYLKDSMGSVYVPSSTLKIENAPLRSIIKALIKKIKLILRIRFSK